MQNDAAVPYRPTLLWAGEIHCRQVNANRHLSLLPIVALIIGIQNVPAPTHCNQALAGMGDVDQLGRDRQFAH
ncbi:hypothetical protein D9M71_816890 [compost metagenome]